MIGGENISAQSCRHAMQVSHQCQNPAMATSATTSVQLEQLTGFNDLQQRTARTREDEGQHTHADPVLEMSRIADSSVPDGGYGWVVISACAVVSFWFTGVSYSYGVIQSALFEQGLASTSTLAFVGSLPPTFISCMAIANSRLIRAVGARWCAISGIVMISLAQIASSFTTQNIAGLFVTAGVALGLGLSLCFTACAITPAQYFSRRRGLANGIVFGGGGLGGAIVTILQGVLIQHVGIPWTYRILGIASLVTGLPAAWLIKERTTPNAAGFVEWGLLKNIRFVLTFAAGSVATFPLLVPAFFLPQYSHSIGLSSGVGVALLTAFNISSAVGRIMCGYLCDKLGPLNTLGSSLMLGAIGMLILWPNSTTLGPLAVFAILNGASNGGFFSTIPTAVGNTFGSARVAVAMGMIVTGWGPGYLLVRILYLRCSFYDSFS